MTQTVIRLEGDGLKTLQNFDLEISVHVTINIAPQEAQRLVTGWVVSEVGNMLIGGRPRLIVSQPTVWRVPIVLGSSERGLLGEVASLDVDVETGELLITETSEQEILAYAQALIRPASPPT